MSRHELRGGSNGSTAMSTTMAIEYLSTKDTVTNTRLSCLATLHRAVADGDLPGPAELASIVQAVLRNLPVGNIRVRREALVIVGVLATRMGGGFSPFLSKTLPLLALRMGDHAAAQKMVAEAASEAFETIQAAVGVRPVYEALLTAKSFEHKSWHVREQLFGALASTVVKYGAADLPLEPLVLCVIAGLKDRAPGTRDAAVSVAVRLYARMGAALWTELQGSGLRDAQLRTLEDKFANVTVDTAAVVPLRPPPGSAGSQQRSQQRGGSRETPQRSARRARGSAPSSSGTQQQLFNTPGSSSSGRRGNGRGGGGGSPPQGSGFADVTSSGAPHSPVIVRSEGELKAEFSSLSEGLQRPDWNERLLSLRRLGGVIASGTCTTFPSFAEILWRSPLRHAITAQLADPRSTIVREVCSLIAQLAQSCGDRLCKLAESWVPELLKLCYNSVQVMRDSADQCISIVIQHSQAPRLLPRVAHAGSSSRHAVLREKCMGFITVAMTHWTNAAVEKNDGLEDVCEAIRLGLNDASPDTRHGARHAFCALSARWPQRAADMQGRLPGTVLKALANHATTAAAAAANATTTTTASGSRSTVAARGSGPPAAASSPSPSLSLRSPTTPMLQLLSTPTESAAGSGSGSGSAAVTPGSATGAGTGLAPTRPGGSGGGGGETSPVVDLLRSERKARKAAQLEQQRQARNEAGLDHALQSVQNELRTTSAEIEEAATGESPRPLPPPSPLAARSSSSSPPLVPAAAAAATMNDDDEEDAWAGMMASPAGGGGGGGGGGAAQPPPVISAWMEDGGTTAAAAAAVASVSAAPPPPPPSPSKRATVAGTRTGRPPPPN